MLFSVLLYLISNVYYTQSAELIPYVESSSCNDSEYFNAELLECETCNKKLHLIPAADKHSCICDPASRSVRPGENANMEFPLCELCEAPLVASADGRRCVNVCGDSSPLNASSPPLCPKCRSDEEIFLQSFANGTSRQRGECVKCAAGTIPSARKSHCIACPLLNPWVLQNGTQLCVCPSQTVLIDRTCVPTGLINEWATDRAYLVQYQEIGETVESAVLKRILLPAVYLCKMKNATACQIVANLCALLLYENYQGSPCRLWDDPRQASTLPWIYYGEGDAHLVLNRRKINAQFTFRSHIPTSWMNITGFSFSLDGRLRGMQPLQRFFWKFCPGANNLDKFRFRFGINYAYSCTMVAQELLKYTDLELVMPFLQYADNSETFLYAIPVLIRSDIQYGNMGNDMANWMLVRRIFVVDQVLGGSGKSKNVGVVRYMNSLEIRVKVRDKSEGGKIYPPYLVVRYSEVAQSDMIANKKIPFSFAIKFEMDSSTTHAIDVSMGVLSAFAVLYSTVQTWSHARRSGRSSIDVWTVVRLCIFACGNLANAFFVVAAGVSIHAFVFYKGQTVVYTLLPSDHIKSLLNLYFFVAFYLKLVQVTALILCQISVHIFLVDWERPRATDAAAARPVSSVSTPTALPDTRQPQPVSIWRTYFIANEWNEIQTKRKINLIVHLMIVGYILEIYGLKYWASSDPDLRTVEISDTMAAQNCQTCRIAVGIIIYLSIYLIQLVFMVGIYERYIKNSVQEFVDLCSMANVSVFIIMLQRYGFYIHGRSAHGFADTDMSSMIAQLQREEDNLCGHRGLIPETDEQTFRMAIPASLYNYYRKLVGSLFTPTRLTQMPSLRSVGRKDKLSNYNMEKCIQAYNNINKFLIAFFEHALKDLDYEVRSKLFVESLLDVEFADSTDRGVLYTDNGHSFDNVLFYGNEITLASFDLMAFTMAVSLFDDYLVAIFLTAICYKVIATIRQYGGRKNIAKKTLIDERFLI